ncbi:MAG: HAMP domain-containing sensor histidine kinase [Oscillospiraceae bacterium]
MNLWNADKIMIRMSEMIDRAKDGEPIEECFDESKMSALESKLANYLAMTQTGSRQLAEEKSKINELISDISHQTKTPIANISLYAQLLAESNLPEKESACAHALLAQADKLNFLISALVKTSRLENGIIVLAPRCQPVQQLLDEVLAQSVAKASQKNIALHSAPTTESACFDAKWTSEAILNIVDNAIKYTRGGGEISIGVTAYSLFCRIDIRDTGIGISEDEQAKVFTRFYRSPTVQCEEGVGIGLYLARKIITGEGGYIKVTSKIGSGSAFSVFLPREG